MNNEVMPERITVHRINNGETFPDNVSVTEVKPGLLLPGGAEEQEYIRADLVTGDAKEPLKYGQYRWVKPHGELHWKLSKVYIDAYGIYEFHVYGASKPGMFESEFSEIGPVIQPPEDK